MGLPPPSNGSAQNSKGVAMQIMISYSTDAEFTNSEWRQVQNELFAGIVELDEDIDQDSVEIERDPKPQLNRGEIVAYLSELSYIDALDILRDAFEQMNTPVEG